MARELAGLETKKAVKDLAGRGFAFGESKGRKKVQQNSGFTKNKHLRISSAPPTSTPSS